jgi:hypothetical protein
MLRQDFVLARLVTLFVARFAMVFAALFAALFVTTGFAQDSAAAMQLYNKGVNLLEVGKGDAARQAFQTIVDKYPGSAYSKLAHEELDKPLVGSIVFKNLAPLSQKEVLKQFELANARLMVGRPYQPDYGDQARTMLAQMMIKRKVKAKDIAVTTRDLPNRKLEVTLTVVK